VELGAAAFVKLLAQLVRWGWRLELVYAFEPAVINFFGNVQLPVDGEEEGDFILVNFLSVQARYLAPSASREVAVLEVLGGQNQSREEHAPTALDGLAGVAVVGLLHRKIPIRHMRLDQYQIVEGYL